MVARHEPTRRPGRWYGWVFASALVAALPWLWRSASHDAVPAPPAAPRAGAVLSQSLSLFAFDPVDARAPDAVSASTSAEPADVRQAEVCGFGPMEQPSVDAALREAALDQVDALMLASDDAQFRAAALLIGARIRRGDDRTRIDSVARLAAGSQDPIVYAIALEACTRRTGVDAGACALLSRTQWVRLDGDNALPWLELAAEARQQQAFDAEAEAMQRAALAHRIDAHAGLLPALVDRALGSQTPPLQRMLALSAGWSAQAGWIPSHANQAQAYCGADAVADRERRPTCETLAEALASRSTSVADLSVGLAIGRNLGWAGERLEALQQEQDAFSEAGGFQAIGADFNCEGVDRLQAWTRQLAARGELQAMRDALARSGRSVEQWSAQYRKNFAVAMAAAEAATSAAPP